jgi:hypothetical protein
VPRPLPKSVRRGLRLDRLTGVWFCCAVASPLGAATAKPAAPAVIFAKEIQPFIAENCLDCHDDDTRKGGLALDAPALATVESMRTNRDTWERVLKNVGHGVMPPPKAAQPEPAERAALVGALEKVLHPIDPAKPDAGRVVLRRLNREEYRNSVHDILGVTFDPAQDFPADDSGYGYDNIGDVLSISPLLFERYLAAARAIAHEVVPERLPASRKLFASPDLFQGDGIELLTPALKLARPMRALWTFHAPASGTYAISASAGSGAGEAGASRSLHYSIEIDGVVVAPDFETGTGSRAVGFEQSAAEVKITHGMHTLAVNYLAVQPPLTPPAGAAPAGPGGGRGGRGPAGGGNFWLHWVRVEGPTNPEAVAPNAAFARLVGTPRPGESREAWINRGVTHLAAPLLRRAPTKGEIAALAAMVRSTIDAGGSLEAGWRTALQAMLVSPSFLFRGEPPGRNEKADRNYALSETELASRLAYFLWSSAPDDRLRDLAAQGKLRANFNAEIKRLLADPRSDRFVRNFAGQWLHLRNLPQRETDPKLYPIWGPALAADMAVETQKFFADFLTNGQPVSKMLTADYSFVSPLLAKFYGLNAAAPAPALADTFAAAPAGAAAAPAGYAGASGAAAGPGRGPGRGGRGPAAPTTPSRPEEFVRTVVPPERQAGLLGQASILALSSYANRTSPVLRGKFVLESLLGAAPPPPPANVPGLPDTGKSNEPATVRERLARHREKPECAICHKDIDPLGFALENFDATGAWRTTENGLPVDAVGELPSGEKVSGAVELSRLLAGARLADFQRNFASQLLTYAIGRGTDYYDRPTIEQIVAVAAKNGSTLPAYIEAVTGSLAFQQRRGEPQPGPAPAQPAAKGKVARQ